MWRLTAVIFLRKNGRVVTCMNNNYYICECKVTAFRSFFIVLFFVIDSLKKL